jgi:hypothetical protein
VEERGTYLNFLQHRDTSLVTADNSLPLRELVGEFGDTYLRQVRAGMQVSQGCEECATFEHDFAREWSEFLRVSEELPAWQKETEDPVVARFSQLAFGQSETENMVRGVCVLSFAMALGNANRILAEKHDGSVHENGLSH